MHDSPGDTGLKVTKAAIIRQAQRAKKDIASGHVSRHARQAVDTLADYSNAAVELLELALDEAAKEQPDQALVVSFIFLFVKASEALRLDIEAGYKTALDIADDGSQAAGQSKPIRYGRSIHDLDACSVVRRCQTRSR